MDFIFPAATPPSRPSTLFYLFLFATNPPAGLPRLLVDIRHEATHNELPSIAALRLAKDQALAWLELNYWHRQKATVDATLARISQLLASYVGLQIAAASKAASAATASAADSDDDSDVDDDGTEAEAQDYHAGDAKKHRQSLVRELKNVVPRPAAHLLATGLLEIDQHIDHVGIEVARQALEATLGQLSKAWAQLPGLLLLASVRAALRPQQGTAPLAAGETEQQEGSKWVVPAWQVWQQVLLPQQSGRGSWVPTEAQAQELVEMCIAARPLAANPSNASFSQDHVGGTLERLLPFIKNPTAAAACRTFLAAQTHTAAQQPELESEPLAVTSVNGIADMLAQAAQRQVQLLQALGSDRHGEANNADNTARNQSDVRAVKRWKRAGAWTPCALGCMPSECDPNGHRCPLDPSHTPTTTTEDQERSELGNNWREGTAAARGGGWWNETVASVLPVQVDGEVFTQGGDWPSPSIMTGNIGPPENENADDGTLPEQAGPIVTGFPRPVLLL